ncbi:MAG: lipase family protein [Caulobacteraceae bacterium]|nr:MAG: lipase family protein [Caulobacteraceae bacterium]
MTYTLTARLLTIARQTYAIVGDGPVPMIDAGPAPTSSNAIGWTAAPYGVQAGLANDDAGLVGNIPEGIVIAIRGTTPPGPNEPPRQVVVDWASDALAVLLPAAGSPPGFPGDIHLGFYTSFMQLWSKLGPAVKAVVAAFPGQTLYVTGHSKGGAICPLVAWRLRQDYPDARIVVRSFAGARVGDAVFAAAYNAALTDHIRYEYDNDIVPHLPAETSIMGALGAPPLVTMLLQHVNPGYASVGTLSYIKADGRLVGDSLALQAQRIARLVLALSTVPGIQQVIQCHDISAPTAGYVRAQYPN